MEVEHLSSYLEKLKENKLNPSDLTLLIKTSIEQRKLKLEEHQRINFDSKVGGEV